jgi:hypothetical protein
MVVKPGWKTLFGASGRKWENNIKINLEEVDCE